MADKYHTLDFTQLLDSDDAIEDIDKAFKPSFEDSVSDNVENFVYLRAVDVLFNRQDSETSEIQQENEVKTKCILHILDM